MEQEILWRGLYVRDTGVVALPQVPAQWTPIQMAAVGLPLWLVHHTGRAPTSSPRGKFTVESTSHTPHDPRDSGHQPVSLDGRNQWKAGS